MSEFDVLDDNTDIDEIIGTNISVSDNNVESVKSPYQLVLDKFKRKAKVMLYMEKFPKELAAYSYNLEKLDVMTIEELDNLILELSFAVNCRVSSSMVKGFYYSGCDIIEKLSPYIGYDLNGFSKTIRNTDEINKCLDEISLQYENEMHFPPHLRLLYATLQSALIFAKSNRVNKIIDEELKKNVKKELIDEYNDL